MVTMFSFFRIGVKFLLLGGLVAPLIFDVFDLFCDHLHHFLDILFLSLFFNVIFLWLVVCLFSFVSFVGVLWFFLSILFIAGGFCSCVYVFYDFVCFFSSILCLFVSLGYFASHFAVRR